MYCSIPYVVLDINLNKIELLSETDAAREREKKYESGLIHMDLYSMACEHTSIILVCDTFHGIWKEAGGKAGKSHVP
jgi:hypothetical protein